MRDKHLRECQIYSSGLGMSLAYNASLGANVREGAGQGMRGADIGESLQLPGYTYGWPNESVVSTRAASAVTFSFRARDSGHRNHPPSLFRVGNTHITKVIVSHLEHKHATSTAVLETRFVL